MKIATFGGGCFWCVEAVFEQLKGVEKVVSGYAGGHVAEPDLRNGLHRPDRPCRGCRGSPMTRRSSPIPSCSNSSGRPTTRPPEPPGHRLRHAVPLDHPLPRRRAEAAGRVVQGQAHASGAFNRPIVTEIVPLEKFYPAEDYHQNYYRLNSRQPYCQFVIVPKLEKFRQVFRDKRKE